MQESSPRSTSKDLRSGPQWPCPVLAAADSYLVGLEPSGSDCWMGHSGTKAYDQQRLKQGEGLMDSYQKPWTQDHQATERKTSNHLFL